MSNNHYRKEIICAFDIGAKNPARTILEIENNIIRIIDISKLDWSTDWEKKVARDISQYDYTSVLLERQPRRSPYVKIIYFIKGYLYNTRSKVICVSPVMTGDSYRERKRRSVETFLNWMNVFGIMDFIPDRRKLDDVADSFNIAMRYILDKLNIKYYSYINRYKKM
ncbi:SPV111 putative DNA processing protein [Swinepox virus]|uniref:Holliday junction resolvase n=2 Tax=Swinepox virus TaxID=10276 RepID=A0A881SY77_SWPV|nr:SPV111 putative DNA processing protein [Swinepox virus]AAL69850.1 SPV111 putative DNA processing protein [Swinepox virus]QQG31601.1 Holliday junction resolvase [Swinepox virus]UED36641.1 SPV111 putative DNA processing protein [Swinepox virus]UED36790.1 SPV111 putative DNA processing protein [Swinepox virus]UUA44301.1 SPV111 [Swinepox virus]